MRKALEKDGLEVIDIFCFNEINVIFVSMNQKSAYTEYFA